MGEGVFRLLWRALIAILLSATAVALPPDARSEETGRSQDPSRSPNVPPGTSHSAGEIPIRPETAWESIRNLFLPDVVRQFYRLRGYLGEDAFDRRTSALHPREKVDEIFRTAVFLTEGDPLNALLVCALATLPYRTFDAVLPLTGWTVTVPVSTESAEQFARRLRNLPAGFLPDSPAGGDKDKLTHFFGSAYLCITLKSRVSTTRIGIWVETLESVFKLDGFSDDRDLDVNERGGAFGESILRHRASLPSQFLR